MTAQISTQCRRLITVTAAFLILLGTTACAESAERHAASFRAGKFDAALKKACASGEVVLATSLIPEKWDRMLVIPEGTYGNMVNDILGFHYTHEDSYFGNYYTGILLNGTKRVVQINFGRSVNPPPVELPSSGYIFDADSLSVTPRSETPESMQKWLERRNQDCILLSPDDTEAFNY